MATIAQTGIVKPPLIAAAWRRWPVADLKGIDGHKWVTTLAALGAFVLVSIQQLVGASGLFAANSVGVTQLGAQLSSLTDQVTRINAKIDAGPRADQIVALGQIISAMGGRMDSLDARVRDSENRIAAIRAQLDLIDQSSRAALGKH